jgi:hypothetical protein
MELVVGGVMLLISGISMAVIFISMFLVNEMKWRSTERRLKWLEDVVSKQAATMLTMAENGVSLTNSVSGIRECLEIDRRIMAKMNGLKSDFRMPTGDQNGETKNDNHGDQPSGV